MARPEQELGPVRVCLDTDLDTDGVLGPAEQVAVVLLGGWGVVHLAPTTLHPYCRTVQLGALPTGVEHPVEVEVHHGVGHHLAGDAYPVKPGDPVHLDLVWPAAWAV